jgi:hypothetical protein
VTRLKIAILLLLMWFSACGDTAEEGPDETDSRTGGDTSDDGPDAGSDADASFDMPDFLDVGADGGDAADLYDGGDVADASDAGDAHDLADASSADAVDTGAGAVCECDTSEFCEEACACDVACTAAIGEAPLGPDSVGLERNELLLFHRLNTGENVTRASLYEDASAGAAVRHPRLWTGAPEDLNLSQFTETGLRPLGLAADVDDDGRDEAIIVTSTGVSVADWNGVSVAYRSVYTYPAAEWFDAATGDLDYNGGRILVVSRQVGDVVTVDALNIAATGDAFLRATVEVPGAVRHAVAVGAPSAGERPLVHLVTTQTPAVFREPVTLQQLRLEDDALVEERSLPLDAICAVGSSSSIPDDGISVLVGDLTPTPGNELFITAYCPQSGSWPQLRAAVHDRDGVLRRWARVGGEITSDAYTSTGRVRPLAALGHFSRLPTEPGTLRYADAVVAWNDSDGYPRVSTFTLHTGGPQDFTGNGAGRLIETDGVVTGLAMRDLNSDGVDELITSSRHLFDSRVVAWHADERLTATVLNLEESSGDPSGPLLVVGDFDGDSIRVRATGNVYRWVTGWDVNAVIAAPPTWQREGVSQAGGSETSFGESSSEGVSHGGVLTYGGSISVGVGVSFYKLVELYGYLTASFGITHSWTLGETTTYASALTAGPEADLVAYSRAIYVSHEYEVVSHPDRELIGERMTIDEVDSVVQTTSSLERFWATVPNATELVPRTLLAHTVGRPDTYDAPDSCNANALNARIGQGVVSDPYESPSLRQVGDAPGGYGTLSVDVETQKEEGVDGVFEVGFEAGGALVVGGWITGYVGGGFSYRKTVGSGATYTGSVGVISEGYGLDTRFHWGLCLFDWANREGEGEGRAASYPVITYVTQPY